MTQQPEQDEARALKEFVLLHRGLGAARGPAVDRAKLTYQQAFLAMQDAGVVRRSTRGR